MRAAHLFFLIALLFGQVLCETLYLSSVYNADDANGSEDKPYSTFAQALNATEDHTDSLEIYVYPGIYAGGNNTNIFYEGPLTIYWFQNASAAEGDATSVQFDCTAASGVPCFSSNTSITIRGLDDAENPQIIFEDCSTCLSIDNSGNDVNDDYLFDIEGVSFSEVSQIAVAGYNLHTVTISTSYFTDIAPGGDGLSLISLVNVESDIKIQNSTFNSLNRNALLIVNTTVTEIDECTWNNANVAISGVDREDSQVVIDDNTFVASGGLADYVVTLSTGIFTIKDTKFQTTNQGSVKTTESSTTSIINSTFASGQAQSGGACRFENVTTVTVSDDTIFTTNVATLYGGAIYLLNSSIHLDATNFTQNVAVDGAGIGCGDNTTTVYYDNSTVFFTGNTNTGGVNTTDIQNTCTVEIQTFQSSLVVSSVSSPSNAWIWVLVAIAILIVILIIVAAVGFVLWQRKRQSYTRMD